MEKQKYFATSLSFGASSTTTTTTTTTTTSPPNMDIQIGHELNCSSDQLPNCFLNLNWENSMDQSVAFESALSSIVSSPVASNNSSVPPPPGESVVIRELIGRLGSICNSGEISPPQFGGGGASNSNYMNNNGNHSTNTSCYSTPLNSPPKLNLSMMDHHNQSRGGNLQFQGNSIQTNNHHHHHPTLTPFPTDPGFAERAARFSCFGGGQFGFNETELPYRSSPRVENEKLSRVSSSQSLKVNGSQMGGGQENKDYPLHDMLDTEMRSVSGSGGGGDRKFSRFSRSSTPEHGEFNNAHEDSSLSEQIPVVETGLKVTNDVNGRKRKATTRGKAKEPPSSSKDTKAEVDDLNAKRSKSGDANGNEKDSAKAKTEQDTPKPPEPPKDYIHVRARRGQATDSHSLAERVRREKISERMKFLQDLVPGCNKVTGKAVMLDEIINYVQSLQRQVEFLSMKLATVNPRLDFNMEALLSKEILQSRGSFPHSMYPLESPASAFPYGHQPQQGPNIHNGLTNGTENPLEAALRRNLSMQLPSLDGFCDSASQLATFWEDDLQSVVQMGFGQNQPQNSHGMSTNHMKVEL